MKHTFTPDSRKPGVTLEPITGTVCFLYGVPMVAHKQGKTWALDEPISGRNICRHSRTRATLVSDATARIELVGGPGALAAAMAEISPRLKSRQLHAPEFAYGAGGPLDAPELINTGRTRFATRAYQIEIPR